MKYLGYALAIVAFMLVWLAGVQWLFGNSWIGDVISIIPAFVLMFYWQRTDK